MKAKGSLYHAWILHSFIASNAVESSMIMSTAASVPPVASNKELSIIKPLLAFAVVALLVASTSYFGFHQIESLFEKEGMEKLGAIADMKAGQIAAWYANHRRVGESYSHDSVLAREFEQWLLAGAPAGEGRQRLLKILADLQHVSGYKTALLLDKQGKVKISSTREAAIGAEEMQLALRAMQQHKVLFYDIHRNSYGDRGSSIDMLAPLSIAGNQNERIVGVAVLQIDPDQFLFPIIQSWPTPSPSAETLLVRQEGSDVLFLNRLRHRNNDALMMRLPMTTPKLPAAMAIKGVRSVTDAIDYRGVRVVAEMRHIPGTPWYVISKVDRDELFGSISHLKKLSAGMGALIASIGVLLVLFWFRGQTALIRLLKAQHKSAIERTLLEKHFEYLTKYANDIIIVADETGNIIEANEHALEVYGYSREELLGKHVVDLLELSEDKTSFKSQLQQLKDEGKLRYEAVSLRKDGSTFPIEISTRQIGVNGVNYFHSIGRDISQRKRDEVALRKSETLLKKSQEMALIGSWELDLKINVLYWSEENYRIFGFEHTPFGASYEAFLDAVHPDDRARVNKAYTDSVNNKTPYSIVHRLLLPDGRIKYVREWCETEYDEAGQPLRSIGTTQDITSQELARQELRRSAERIEDLYNNAPCGYQSLDVNGVFIKINNTELKWLGRTRDEVVGKMNFRDFLTPASQEAFLVNYPKFKSKGFIHDVEYELVRKDGTHFPVLLNATALFDDEGKFVMSRATMFDITARKQAENKLVESESRFRTMADSAPVMIWMANAADQKSFPGCNIFNQRWYQFTGIEFDLKPSCDWQNHIHFDDRNRCIDAYRKAFSKRQSFSIKYRLRCRDGVFRWIEDVGVPRFAADGEYLGFIGTCTDITEHNLYEILRGEMEHIDRLNIAVEMASGLAHELSQPLSAANTYLVASLNLLAANSPDYDGIKKSVTQAQAQTERAGRIINHLKELVSKQKSERIELDINAVIKDSIKFLEHELHQNAVNVMLDLAPVPPMLANKIEIEQVLINLAKNAIDSMRSSLRRDLHIASQVLESGAILVKVSDSGKGISVEDLERVFDPFHSSKKDGLGLGLTICRSLVGSYGGKVWAEQKEDVGCEFNFTLMTGGSNE